MPHRGAKARRTKTSVLFEFRREMLRMAEANCKANFRQRALLTNKKVFGALNAPTDDILMRGIAGAFGKCPNEMSSAQSDQRSHLHQSDRPTEVFLDELGDPFKIALGESASVAKRRLGAAHPL
jgi:hypothetical protein